MFLAEAGARPVGFDLSERQLSAARQLMRGPYPLVHADAQRLPFARASFDVVLSDHGAMSWADPFLTVPEVARVLRPGGRLVFNASTPWITVCWNGEETTSELSETYFGLHRIDEGSGASTFVLGYGDWILSSAAMASALWTWSSFALRREQRPPTRTSSLSSGPGVGQQRPPTSSKRT